MSSALPSNYVPADQDDPAVPSKYFQLKKIPDGGTTTIRLCGTASSGHCIAGYQYFTAEGRPRRFESFPKNYLEDIGLTFEGKNKGTGEKSFPGYFLAWIAKRKEADGYQVLEITQQKVREAIEATLRIPDYVIPDGELANFYLTIGRKGSGKDTAYSVTPVLKAPTAAESKHWAAVADTIWAPALFAGGDPFEGRPNGAPRPAALPAPPQRDGLGADDEEPALPVGNQEEVAPSGW